MSRKPVSATANNVPLPDREAGTSKKRNLKALAAEPRAQPKPKKCQSQYMHFKGLLKQSYAGKEIAAYIKKAHSTIKETEKEPW